jgi:hypothetical protein
MAPRPSISIGPRPQVEPKPPRQFPGKPDPTKPGKRPPGKGDPAYNPDVTHPPNNPRRPLPQR